MLRFDNKEIIIIIYNYFYLECQPFYEWAIPEKIQTRGGRGGRIEDMEFAGVLKKKHVEIPGVN